MQFLDRGPGVDAELLGEQACAVAVRLQGLGAAAGAVVGQHQLGEGLFAQRVRPYEAGELPDQFAVLAAIQAQGGELFVHVEAELGQALGLRFDPFGGDAG